MICVRLSEIYGEYISLLTLSAGENCQMSVRILSVICGAVDRNVNALEFIGCFEI